MARPRQHTPDAILDAALLEGSERGFERMTAAGVASRLGAPSGSVYHCFKNRDVLVESLWLRTVQRFQQDLSEVLERTGPPAEVAVAAAVHVVQWSRDNRLDAMLLSRYRRRDLLAEASSSEFSAELEGLNHAIGEKFVSLGRRMDIPDAAAKLRFACIVVPLAAVRDLLAGETEALQLERLVETTVRAVLGE